MSIRLYTTEQFGKFRQVRVSLDRSQVTDRRMVRKTRGEDLVQVSKHSPKRQTGKQQVTR